MTPGVSLHRWESIGILSRELKIYRMYASNGWHIKVLTYDKRDLNVNIEGVSICYIHKYLLPFLSIFRIKEGLWADIIKTNQSHNAIVFALAALVWRKKLYLRCGYIHGEYLESVNAPLIRRKLYTALEKLSYYLSSCAQVPTVSLKNWLIKSYHLDYNKIIVVPNYVDTDQFKYIEKDFSSINIITVARLHEVKRLTLIIDLAKALGVNRVTIVGSGDERNKLLEYSNILGVRLSIIDRVDNNQLPDVYEKYTIFVITSIREGNPKALLEAMSCGLIVAGLSADGVSNIISNNITGLLADNITNLSESILKLFDDYTQLNFVSSSASNFILNYYSLNSVYEQESKQLMLLINGLIE